MSTAFETMTCAYGSSHLHRYIFGIINYLGIDIKHHESMQVRHWRSLIMLTLIGIGKRSGNDGKRSGNNEKRSGNYGKRSGNDGKRWEMIGK